MAASIPAEASAGYSEAFRAIGGGSDITVDQFKARRVFPRRRRRIALSLRATSGLLLISCIVDFRAHIITRSPLFAPFPCFVCHADRCARAGYEGGFSGPP